MICWAAIADRQSDAGGMTILPSTDPLRITIVELREDYNES